MLYLKLSTSRMRNKRHPLKPWQMASLVYTTISCLLIRGVLGWLKDSEKQHLETLEAVRSTAQEQVPFNVQSVS